MTTNFTHIYFKVCAPFRDGLFVFDFFFFARTFFSSLLVFTLVLYVSLLISAEILSNINTIEHGNKQRKMRCSLVDFDLGRDLRRELVNNRSRIF